ncbi:MAG: hypothetical protein NVSMB1_08750 [Polyangiales bacterium]
MRRMLRWNNLRLSVAVDVRFVRKCLQKLRSGTRAPLRFGKMRLFGVGRLRFWICLQYNDEHLRDPLQQ